MYKFDEITEVHLEITSKCQAKCPMCARNLQGGKVNPLIDLDEVTLEQFKEWFPVAFIMRLKSLYMCGNLGDPIVAKDTVAIFKYLRTHNSSLQLRMHTNGSGRHAEWWKELAALDVYVIFGIDGLSDTHSLYRINTDWNKIIENATTFISSGGSARWDMIVFQHNEHQVEDCRLLSQQLGFAEFTVKHTSRFREGKLNVLNDEGKTINILFPTSKSHSMIDKVKKAKEETLPTIYCKAKKTNQIYISATGTVTPCCWTDMEYIIPLSTPRIDYLDVIGHWPNLKKQSLHEIFTTGYFDKIEQAWSTCGLKVCSKQCGSFDRLNEQWTEGKVQ
jgi:MoaA/NifB/PqqE/SkfB family radical SAM enzyme